MQDPDARVREIVIVGGGTAGWMAAAALAKLLPHPLYSIRVVESDEIGIVGVGEATIPMIKLFNNALEIDEYDFLRFTKGTYKLGIEFVDWARVGDRYFHGFGKIGQDLGVVPFYQYWLKMHALGRAAPLEEYAIATWASRHDRFMRAVTDRPNSPLADIAYAYNFDASLYSKYLRAYAEKRGVERIEGKVTHVEQDPDNGHVRAVSLERGERVAGQLFVDCTGFRGLLIEQTLKAGYTTFSDVLPCDRALAVPCASAGPLTPYVRCTARSAGWQWRIPLQHRIGNGYVYSSRHISDDEAAHTLLSSLDGEALAEPRPLRFVPGRRNRVWDRNVVAIGLASGFMEPLESTSIHLIQSAIARLTAFFPHAGFDQADIDEFNRHSQEEVERIRDFIVLHYHATERSDSPFWNVCRTMAIPPLLKLKMDLWRANGRVFREGMEMFAEQSWVQVLHGQRVPNRGYHALADMQPEEKIHEYLEGVRSVIDNCVRAMPTHEEFIAKRCAAVPESRVA